MKKNIPPQRVIRKSVTKRGGCNSTIILFNKPYGVLSQFKKIGVPTLGDYINEPGFYAAGRLDKDSEGLLILTNNGHIQHILSHPVNKLPKTYWVQVEGVVSETAVKQLQKGVLLKDGLTRAAKIKELSQAPELWPRIPPIRERKNIPTCWLEITITEGRNRQLRRMTAAVGFPTLRLVRVKIGEWSLNNLQPGELSHKRVKL